MAEINSILIHFTNSSELSQENIALAKKTALLELKFSPDSVILIAGKSYSKDELIQVFDYYDNPLNILILKEIEHNPDIKFIEELNMIGRFAKVPENFESLENHSQIIDYVTQNYADKYFKKLLELYKSKTDYNFKRVIYLHSFLAYFTITFRDKCKNYIKNSILSELREINDHGKKLHPKYVYKELFLFKSSFIQICGLVGNNDDEFLVDVLNTTINVYNNYKRNPELLLNSFRAHKQLNHAYENQILLDQNIKVFEKQENNSSDSGGMVKSILYVVVFLIIVFLKGFRSCSHSTPNYQIPNYNNYSYPINSIDPAMDGISSDSLVVDTSYQLENGQNLNVEILKRQIQKSREEANKLEAKRLEQLIMPKSTVIDTNVSNN